MIKNFTTIINFIFIVLVSCSCSSNNQEGLKLNCSNFNSSLSPTLFNHVSEKINIYFSLNDALSESEIQNKPILKVYTGLSAYGKRDLDWRMFKGYGFEDFLAKNFIVCFLVVDNKSKLISNDTINSNYKNLGDCYYDLLLTRYKSESLPRYAIVNSRLEDLVESIGYVKDSLEIAQFLVEGEKSFHSTEN